MQVNYRIHKVKIRQDNKLVPNIPVCHSEQSMFSVKYEFGLHSNVFVIL